MGTAYRLTNLSATSSQLRTYLTSLPCSRQCQASDAGSAGSGVSRKHLKVAWLGHVTVLNSFLSRSALILISLLLLSSVPVGRTAPPVPGISSAAASSFSSSSSATAGRSRPSLPAVRHSPGPGRGSEEGDPDPLARLSRVFGIKRIPLRIINGVPPQYMTELYDTVADHNGLTRAAGPYNANTVRSLPDRDSVHQEHFFYNVSFLSEEDAQSERMLEAEFHVFKMKPRPARSAEPLPPHHLQLKLYQVTDMNKMNTSEGLILLDSRRISTHAHGWYTFKVTKAVENWKSGYTENNGLLLTAETGRGERLSDSSYVRFAQRHQHHDSKQPILVLFAHDGNMKTSSNFVSPDDQDYREIREELEKTKEKEEKDRQRPQQQQPVEGQRETPENPVEPSGFSRDSNFRQAVHMLNEQARGRQPTAKIPEPVQFSAASTPSPADSRQRRRREALPANATTSAAVAAAGTAAGGGEGKKGGGTGKKKKNPGGGGGAGGGGGRRKRMYDAQGYRYRRSCAKHKMYVDFDEIGWSGWIISPKGYDAYHCHGDCPFPLGQSQKPTNHATVQSIVHALRVGTKHVGTPCCVPNKLFSISLLYFDDDENVILKQYDDMVAASCGCH